MTSLITPTPTSYAAITAFGGFRGERVIPNDDVVGPIDSSDEWIQRRTGIKTRRYANPETGVIEMSVNAANDALGQAGLTGDDIDAVIVSTVTHFVQTPAAATVIANEIGARHAPAFDVSAACAGFTYAIAQADALVRAGTATNVVVVGVEKMSDYLDPADRSIGFLLGDGAGAAIVSRSDTPGIAPTVWGADGSKADAIYQSDSWLAYRERDDVPLPTLRQLGPTVFKWATVTMTDVAGKAIKAAGLTPADIDVFVPHQANMRITDHLVKHLGLRDDVVVARDIEDTGNTSAASIPLATERLIREGQAKSGDISLQIGFGAGLAYAAQVVVLP